MEENLNSSMQPYSNERRYKLEPPDNAIQSLRIEKLRLDFLHKCKFRKRPPQSLRLSGANGLPNQQRIILVSRMESDILLEAIEKKKRDIKYLENKLTRNTNNNNLASLSTNECKRWTLHFRKKLEFFKKQEKTKWKEWPSKERKPKKKRIKRSDKKAKQIRKLAATLLEQKQVINLLNYEVPPEAITVLGKGFGFVRSPKADAEELRLDGRRFTNKLAIQSYHVNNDDSTENVSVPLPKKLKQVNYQLVKPHQNDNTSNNIINNISRKMDFVNSKLKSEAKENLSKLEIDGLNWLQEKTSNMEIIVDSADKGGAILIYPPELAKKKIIEKVTNKQLYTSMNTDPSENLYNDLINLWKEDKQKKFVSKDEAQKVVGLTTNNRKSTSSHFKPGETYFNPSLKIHKMEVNDIKPGCDPPARLITCLQDGVTSRSDVFITNRWLKSLQNDFCKDIVNDSVDVLNWLNSVSSEVNASNVNNVKPFTFDFAALYDSLTPALVEEAIKFSINQCRPDWDNSFIEWIIKMIKLSMSAGFGKFEEKWFKPLTGIPTGGNISVQLANIAVFYAMYKCLFSKQEMMNNVLSTIRFIDDGSGIFNGTQEEFNSWKNTFTQNLKDYGLTIKDEDWDVALQPNDMVHILDIKFGFDEEGNLVTDLYRKETDSRGYLCYSSCHPNHVFSGIVYSQAMRLKRIISREESLLEHLDEMKVDFYKAGYPKSLVKNILEKVISMPRSLERKGPTPISDDVILTSTYGRDAELTKTVKGECESRGINVRYVKKTGPTLKSKLSNLKYVSLGAKHGHSRPCGKPRCKSCPLMSGKDHILNRRSEVKTAKGNCKTRNFIYGATCKLCKKIYVGKSTQLCHKRVNGHRDSLREYVKNQNVVSTSSNEEIKDKYSLACHLHKQHNILFNTGLDDNFEFTVLEKCTPRSLDIKEHLWIQKLKTITPRGLNLYSPLGFPLLL